MPCFDPRHGFKSRTVNSSGKRSIVFNPSYGYRDLPVTVPCGQCIGCRLDRSRQWAMRCVHEASLHETNCFITLTYAPEHLPKNGSLKVSHYQKFMKRLRKEIEPNKIRFFHCGEYGEENQRPHYHAIIFGYSFPDKKPLRQNRRGDTYMVSEMLSKLWPYGFSTIGEANFETAAYVARYITKKITGKAAEAHYNTVDAKGEIFEKKPEYVTMSRRPGIARGWFDKYTNDVYPSDYVVFREKKMSPPKFYDKILEKLDPTLHKKLKAKRKRLAQIHEENNTPARLRIREECQKLKARQLKRSYEKNDT